MCRSKLYLYVLPLLPRCFILFFYSLKRDLTGDGRSLVDKVHAHLREAEDGSALCVSWALVVNWKQLNSISTAHLQSSWIVMNAGRSDCFSRRRADVWMH